MRAARAARRCTRWFPGTRSPGSCRPSAPQVTRFAVGDRVGVGNMVDSCRVCASCRCGPRAILCRPRARLQRDRARRRAHLWRLQREDRRRRAFRSSHPREHSPRQRGAAVLCGDHAVFPAATLEGGAGQARGHRGLRRPGTCRRADRESARCAHDRARADRRQARGRAAPRRRRVRSRRATPLRSSRSPIRSTSSSRRSRRTSTSTPTSACWRSTGRSST